MRIIVHTNVTPSWSPDEPKSWGGGEEALVLWGRGLVEIGHDVTIIYDGPTTDDVIDCALRWHNRAEAAPGPFDLAIYRKTPEALSMKLAPRQIVWTDQVRWFDPTGCDRVVVASAYLARALRSLIPALAPIDVIPDGFDGDAMAPRDDDVRQPGLVLAASSPDRGLTRVLDALLLLTDPNVPQETSTKSLAFTWTYGWDLYLTHGGSPALKDEIDAKLAVLRERLGSERVTIGRRSYDGIHRLFRTAGVWAHYCTQGEFFCQAAVKARVGGAIPVVRPWGALQETARGGLFADSVESFAEQLRVALDESEQPSIRETLDRDDPSWAGVCVVWDTLATRLTESDAAPWTGSAPGEPTREPASDALQQPSGGVSRLLALPSVPPSLLGEAAALVPAALSQTLQGWTQRVQAKAPIAEPSLGLAFPPIPKGQVPDAIAVGWCVEDSPHSPAETLAGIEQLQPGMKVLLATSLGRWRSKRRRRALTRRDLAELFGQQPDCTTDVVALDGEGNGVAVTTFRYQPALLGSRNVERARRVSAPRESLSVCFIVPNRVENLSFYKTLRSVETIADEVVVCFNGTRPATPANVPAESIVDEWRNATGIPVRKVQGTTPQFCYDCREEHEPGALWPGHRFAGFETPRNQSIAPAQGDWILWMDSDETLLHPERLTKYLRPNYYLGYGVPHDHHSSDPPEAFKRDTPVRLFRRRATDDAVGLEEFGPHRWPTFNPGLDARFAGIVHEHPGLKGDRGDFADGLGPVLILGDAFLFHDGYATEAMRKRRFVRNWPLMAADHQKYPERRLGQFLWLRDLSQFARYMAHPQQPVPPDAVWAAEEAIRVFEAFFVEKAESFTADAVEYVTPCYALLGRGVDVDSTVTINRPELGGPPVVARIKGRVGTPEQAEALAHARLVETERFTGVYV